MTLKFVELTSYGKLYFLLILCIVTLSKGSIIKELTNSQFIIEYFTFQVAFLTYIVQTPLIYLDSLYRLEFAKTYSKYIYSLN